MDSQNFNFRYAVDAGAFYTGVLFLSSARAIYYTTSAVFNEVKHIKKSHGASDALLVSNTLQVVNPDRESIEKVVVAAKRTGDYTRLSQADISIVALALQLKIALMTDDYAVANTASTLKIPINPASGKGIKDVRRWIPYCNACHKAFGPNTKECPLCGNRLRRKYKVI